MALQPLFDTKNTPMRVICFMSGSGSNVEKIIEHQKMLEADGKFLYDIVAIFSDTKISNAEDIGMRFGIPVRVNSITEFYERNNAKRIDMSLRSDFDRMTLEKLDYFDADVAAYAGYMSIASKVLVDAYMGINVHPADLSITDDAGARKYAGWNAVRDQIFAGEKFLRSSTHLLTDEVDRGPLLMVSKPVKTEFPKDFDRRRKFMVREVVQEHQDRLKEIGDWVIFPKTLQYIAEGRYARDKNGNIYFDGNPIPDGVRL